MVETESDLETSVLGAYLPLILWTNILMIANAVIGAFLYEWAWYKTRRFRHPIKELDHLFPEIWRFDAPDWKKWKQYPGAVSVLVPRIVICSLITLVIAVGLNVLMMGHSHQKALSGWRKHVSRALLKFGVTLVSIIGYSTFLGWDYLSPEQVNHYEDYLGPVELQKQLQADETTEHPAVPKRGPGPASTIVCNHIGFMEIMNLIVSPISPSFTPKIDVRKLPMVHRICVALQCMYVQRAGTKEERDALVKSFAERQEMIEVQNEQFAPLCIFPEATTTNGTRLLPFKRGAFEVMRSCQPCFYQITSGQVSPTYEAIDFLPLQVMMLTSLIFKWSRITIMPEFTPNSYMLEQHADKGDAPWKIYAWCVRDAISRFSGIKKIDSKLKQEDKNNFCKLMAGNADKVEINGCWFEYDGDQPVQSAKLIEPKLVRRKSLLMDKLLNMSDNEDAKPLVETSQSNRLCSPQNSVRPINPINVRANQVGVEPKPEILGQD